MNTAPPLDRTALLCTAASVLLSRMPTWQARFSAHGGTYRARFEWPGIVTVADDNTGEVLARSVCGKPDMPDSATLAKVLQTRRP
jgi:hypothetical protein